MTLVASLAFAIGALSLLCTARLARIAVRARSRKRCLSPLAFVGLEGWSESPLDPVGHVVVRGELWEAIAESSAPRGTLIRVVGAAGTRLRVTRVDERLPRTEA